MLLRHVYAPLLRHCFDATPCHAVRDAPPIFRPRHITPDADYFHMLRFFLLIFRLRDTFTIRLPHATRAARAYIR